MLTVLLVIYILGAVYTYLVLVRFFALKAKELFSALLATLFWPISLAYCYINNLDDNKRAPFYKVADSKMFDRWD